MFGADPHARIRVLIAAVFLALAAAALVADAQ